MKLSKIMYGKVSGATFEFLLTAINYCCIALPFWYDRVLSLPAEKVKIILLYLLYIPLLFSKLNNFLKVIYPFEYVLNVYMEHKCYQKFLSILKAFQGMLMVISQSFVGVSKECCNNINKMSNRNIERTQKVHMLNIMSVKGEKNYSSDTFKCVLFCLNY